MRLRSDRRIWVLVAGCVAVIVVVVQAVAQGATAAQQVDALLAGVSQTGEMLGSPAAPVTLEFFGDLQDSTSRAFAVADVPHLVSRWVRDGELRIEYLSQETVTSRSSIFMAQQTAALAAGIQGKGWYYIELFYREPSQHEAEYVTDAHLDRLAEQVPGLNVARWRKDRGEPSLSARIAQDEQAAALLRIHDTPGLLVGRTGGRYGTELPPFTVCEPRLLYTAVERVLASSRSSALEPSSQEIYAAWAASKKTRNPELASC